MENLAYKLPDLDEQSGIRMVRRDDLTDQWFQMYDPTIVGDDPELKHHWYEQSSTIRVRTLNCNILG